MRPILLLISGMLAVAIGTSTAFAAPPPSGFLDTYPPMQPDPKRPGASIYIAPNTTLKGLDKVVIDPILVFYSPDSKYQGIDPNELSAVTEHLRTALKKSLEPKYPVVDAIGPGVLRVRVAITNVVAEKKKRGILGYTPVGFVIGTAKNLATAGPNINLNSATVEAELIDPSGKQLAVVVDPLVSGESKKEALTWDQIATVLDAAGQRLRTRMDADNAN
ncbi:MAG TPA: DUF3313 domain-containing protein [Luteibacter sp.]|nr:DUF3313 domain-containing protein [Luteibacter sp.]